ncbi:Mrh transcription modulator under heat shock [Citrobacter phage Merlin]|uniref:Uncharacterized protein n=1 Tax=Citrobacter phage Merlin TaxID=1675602 RepID=A0A0K1LN78_9CAUD|nr:Mrh transcription modulator under heat shock [Citrobacter phage Merlin]AKU43668.1 hypothetical protein CPT_Merlin22 [Citrobacter phage Merlin]
MEKCVNISKKYSIELSKKVNGRTIIQQNDVFTVIISAFASNSSTKHEDYFNEQIDKLINGLSFPESAVCFIRHEADVTQKPGTPFGHIEALNRLGYDVPRYQPGDKLFINTEQRTIWKKFLIIDNNDFDELQKFIWNHYEDRGLIFTESESAKLARESLYEQMRLDNLSLRYGR